MLKRDEARLTHRIKTLYGFNVLKAFVEDDGKTKAGGGGVLVSDGVNLWGGTEPLVRETSGSL